MQSVFALYKLILFSTMPNLDSCDSIFQQFYKTVKNYVMKVLGNNTECSGNLRFLSYFIFDCCLFNRRCTVSTMYSNYYLR